jgi:hypothetical protein
MSAPTTQFRYNPLTGKLDLSDVAGGGGGSYPGGVVAWTDVTGTSQAMSVDNGYTANNALTQISFTLPASCGYGKVFRIVGKGFGGWAVNANAGQVIHYGVLDTSDGGSIASTQQYDCIELLCTVEDTEFTVISGPQGNLDVN